VVVLIALSPHSDIRKVTGHLLRHCGIERPPKGSKSVHEVQAQIGGKKANFVLVECLDREDTLSHLDLCKIADIVLLVATPRPKAESEGWNDCMLALDERSKVFCSVIKSVGGASGATVYGLYQAKFYRGLSDLKKNNKAQQCRLQPAVKGAFLKYLSHQFGAHNDSKRVRVFDCYDAVQIFRFCHDTKHYNDSKAVRCEWRQKRPHLLVQSMPRYDQKQRVLQIDGYLRGSTLFDVHRPVHITGFGDYVVDRVDGLIRRNRGSAAEEDHDDDDDDDSKMAGDGLYDSVVLVTANKEKRESVQAVGDLDALASQFDQTMITEQELEEIEEERRQRVESERLHGLGLSDYNKQWIPEEEEKEEDGKEEEAERGWRLEAPAESDGEMELDGLDQEDENNDEDEEAKQREIEREELEFPDEVEIPNGVRAKDEFAAYRGLRQFYKTKWDKMEELPVEYGRIASIGDWNKALKVTKLSHILKAQEQMDRGEMVECGKRVRLHIAGVSEEEESRMRARLAAGKPVMAWSLLQHESKVSVLNLVVRKWSAEYEKPVEGLRPLILDVGVRRFRACPVFSEHSRGNKHLVKQFMSDSQFVMASVYGHITYPPAGVVMMDEKSGAICGHGSLHNVDAHRLLIERKVLTGKAIRVQRRRAVVREMFFNADDVRYFKPIDLWTKKGLKGRIEEPVGDKGLMKCFFNGFVQQNDTVCLSLYKRVFPATNQELFGKMT